MPITKFYSVVCDKCGEWGEHRYKTPEDAENWAANDPEWTKVGERWVCNLCCMGGQPAAGLWQPIGVKPPENENVLVRLLWDEHDTYVCIASYDNENGWRFQDGNHEREEANVIAWAYIYEQETEAEGCNNSDY